MAKRTVETGQRYRDLRRGINGRSAASEWIVEDVQTDAQGTRHARLVSVADPTMRKTLAGANVEVLFALLDLTNWPAPSAFSTDE